MERIRLGVLTPSSNTVLEPMTAAMLSAYTQVTAHFSRTKVSEISLREKSQSQFNVAHFLPGADLLADARVQVIAWSGTSAGWQGFEADQALCRLIEQRTGVVATTSVLALNEPFRFTGVRRFGLVTPYLNDIQRRIIDNYENAGFECVAEKHLDDQGNFSFADVSEKVICDMVRRVAREKPMRLPSFARISGVHIWSRS